MMCFVIGRVKIIVNWKKHLLVIYCFLLPYLNLDFHSLEKLKGLYFGVTNYLFLFVRDCIRVFRPIFSNFSKTPQCLSCPTLMLFTYFSSIHSFYFTAYYKEVKVKEILQANRENVSELYKIPPWESKYLPPLILDDTLLPSESLMKKQELGKENNYRGI